MACAFLLITGSRASGQEDTAARKSALVVHTENDDWPPDTGTDKNYTNAIRVTLDRNFDMWQVDRWPLVGRLVKKDGKKLPNCSLVVAGDPPDTRCASSSFHIGQQFYTPDDITISELIPNDRPYAGWLYVGGSWKSSTYSRQTATDVYIGATGDASLARQTQRGWHALRFIQAADPKGWDHQIGNRLGIVVHHNRRKAFERWTRDKLDPKARRWLEPVVHWGFTGGNIISDAYAGAQLKIGANLSRDWTQLGIGPRVVLGRPPDPAEPQWELYFLTDVQGRALLYNAFIDAAPEHDLHRNYAVADLGAGLGVRVKWFSVSYRVAFVTPEYEEANTHNYKAIRLTFALP
jgi:lipid A 3-O-deacylase